MTTFLLPETFVMPKMMWMNSMNRMIMMLFSNVHTPTSAFFVGTVEQAEQPNYLAEGQTPL
eukprot:1138663-Pelagomonas_calceolata.AAC.3